MKNRNYVPERSNRDILTNEGEAPKSTLSRTLELNQSEIAKQEVFINFVKSELEDLFRRYIDRITCAPMENYSQVELNMETYASGVLVTFTVSLWRNPAVKQNKVSESIQISLPNSALTYITEYFNTESNPGITLGYIPREYEPKRAEVLAVIEKKVNDRFISKFVIPNINRILALE